MDNLDKKRSDLTSKWVPEEHFARLSEEHQRQLHDPSRSVLLPDIDVTSHLLNTAGQIAIGMITLARRGSEANKQVDPAVFDDIRENLDIILGFLKTYGITQ